jgi:hypothetical protein
MGSRRRIETGSDHAGWCWAHAQPKLFEVADMASKGHKSEADGNLAGRVRSGSEVRMPKPMDGLTRFLKDGRICLSNNAAEQVLRVALGRKSWLFAGFGRGGERAAIILTLTPYRQAQRCGYPGPGSRRARPDCRSQDDRLGRAAGVELALRNFHRRHRPADGAPFPRP